MSAALLAAAADDGVKVALTTRGTLKLVGTAEAIGRWRDRIAASKPDIITALGAPSARTVPDPDALAEDFEERAAIAEHDGGLPREQAEQLAWRRVYCQTCTHWEPNPTNPAAGMGWCSINAWQDSRAALGDSRPGFPPWPAAPRYCEQWQAKEVER